MSVSYDKLWKILIDKKCWKRLNKHPYHYLLYGTMMQILYVLKFLKTSMHLAYTN